MDRFHGFLLNPSLFAQKMDDYAVHSLIFFDQGHGPVNGRAINGINDSYVQFYDLFFLQ